MLQIKILLKKQLNAKANSIEVNIPSITGLVNKLQ